MTRFARAQGAKTSERLPEDATSWQQMRQQLLEKQKSSNQEHVQKLEVKHWKDFDDSFDQKSEWTVFEEPSSKSEDKKKRKHKNLKSPTSDVNNSEHEGEYSKKNDTLHKVNNLSDKVKKKEKKLLKKMKEVFAKLPVSEDGKNEFEAAGSMEAREQKNKFDGHGISTLRKTNDSFRNKKQTLYNKKQMNISEQKRDNFLVDGEKIRNKDGDTAKKSQQNFTNKQNFGNNKNNRNMRNFGDRKDRPYQRRKPEEPIVKMFINGREISIVKFDGFPVRIEDAERLKELRQKLISKKIPKSEINHTMKLERRKAEKALAREKKKVCFNCRKAGHMLSECPELGNDTATGICFKCGSTEHTHFECKVVRGQKFKFADCYICKEQGHIARQCPDNPRGLYPKGGACNVCGDVTHLKKDCPDLIQEKEKQAITLGTLDNNSLEFLDEDVKKTKQVSHQKKIKTVVKF